MYSIVSALYYHPEAYPPTLNAVAELSKVADNITIVHRPHLLGGWKYNKNVTAVASGRYISSRDQESSSKILKATYFIRFTFDLFVACIKKRPKVILVYDVHALFSYSLIRHFLADHLLWYHNHDVSEQSRESRFSIGWFACAKEKELFPQIDLFTLPTRERLKYFPIEKLKGEIVVVPNYPSKDFYSRFIGKVNGGNELKLIFQGRVASGHGLEEIIPLLGREINGRKIRLILKGFCEESYKSSLLTLAVGDQKELIDFVGFTPYEEVPKVASSCHVGIAIFAKDDLMNATLGSASNKVYEYAALGLPAIYLKESPVGAVLSDYLWAVGTFLNTESIYESLMFIVENYDQLRASALRDFEHDLNFEKVFAPVIDFLERNR